MTRFVYEEGEVSSMSSSTSQTTSTSTHGSSNYLTVDDETRERGGQWSLADRIQENVDDSIERAMPWLRD